MLTNVQGPPAGPRKGSKGSSRGPGKVQKHDPKAFEGAAFHPLSQTSHLSCTKGGWKGCFRWNCFLKWALSMSHRNGPGTRPTCHVRREGVLLLLLISDHGRFVGTVFRNRPGTRPTEMGLEHVPFVMCERRGEESTFVSSYKRS